MVTGKSNGNHGDKDDHSNCWDIGNLNNNNNNNNNNVLHVFRSLCNVLVISV